MSVASTIPANNDEQHTSSLDGSAAEIEKLRSILLHDERASLSLLRDDVNTVQHRQSDTALRTKDISDVLASATKKAAKENDAYSAAIKPIIVEQFQVSSRENPEIMAEALFPILGPAIRKMIASMLSLDSNKKKRTYKFEQLFLIEKESGLPICHAKAENAEAQDADMVSGMLSAIQSFVQDAFATQEFDGLNTLQLGELSVWIEWGPSAVIAAVIRGVAPVNCREALQQLLEDIHSDYSSELKAYSGDATPFEKIEPDFLLFMDNHDSRLRNRVRNMSAGTRKTIGVLAALSLFAVAWLFISERNEAKFNRFVSLLDDQPGIVVTATDTVNGSQRITGLRDPLAVSANVMLANSDVSDKDIIFRFEPYRALLPEFTVKRIEKVIVPPDSVRLELIGTELFIHGAKSKSWIEQTHRLTRQFNEVTRVVVLPSP